MYRLNVDGTAGKNFQNIPLLANDSLFVFIETTVDITDNGLSFLYTDALQFDSGERQQEVQLVTLVKDAVFIFPPTNPDGSKTTVLLGQDNEGNDIRVEGVELTDSQLNFSNEKPYVIYGYAAVPEDRTLTVEAGARVHFHENSGIWVRPGATLQINGSLSADTVLLEKEVIFEGDRLEPEFDAVAGQWGSVWLSNGSIANSIDHLTLKNATIGLFVEGDDLQASPTLTITNSQIYNSASVNLWGSNAKIVGANMVLGGAGAISLYCSLGGDYNFTHSTIANYWSGGFRRGPALTIDNEVSLTSGDKLQGNLLNASFVNCIVAGSNFKELDLFDNGNNDFNFSFDDCLIQFDGDSDNPLFDFTNTTYYNSIFLNENFDFKNAFQNDFRLGSESFALDSGQINSALQVPLDILGTDRTSSPDLGAYEFTVEE